MHELRSVACHTAAGHPSVPNFGGEMPLIMEHMSPFPARRGSRGGWWMAREGAGRPSRERDRGSARREASDAKSVLIMAIQDRSKTAFLIWPSADRKHATR